MENVTIGSIEELIVDIDDVLDTVTDLTTSGPHYEVKDRAGNTKMANAVATVDSMNKMRLHCLINTTAGGNWEAGRYDLYVWFTSAPEVPKVGPLEFKVNP